ncbi:MAG: hypothetical protein AAGA55_08240 [Planctomycetota bacterium]
MPDAASMRGDVKLRIIHLIGSGACLLILGGASALGVVPALRARAADQSLRADLGVSAAALDSAGDAHVRLVDQARGMRESIRSRDVELMPASGVNRLMADLTVMFENSALSLLTLQPRSVEEARAGEALRAIPIQATAEGRLEDVLGLFGTIRRQHPDIHMEGLVLEHTGPETLRLRADFRWLIVPDKEPN